MHNVLVAGFEVDLMDEASSGESKEAAAGDEGVTPVGEALRLSVLLFIVTRWCDSYHACVYSRTETEVLSRPC